MICLEGFRSLLKNHLLSDPAAALSQYTFFKLYTILDNFMCTTSFLYIENEFQSVRAFPLLDGHKTFSSRRGLSLHKNCSSLPPVHMPPLHLSFCLCASRATDQHRASPLVVGELPAEKSKQRRETARCYQEALKQQVRHQIYKIYKLRAMSRRSDFITNRSQISDDSF